MGITMVDTSVFGALNRANSAPAIAKDLQQLAASGETLMVGSSTYQEILNTPEANMRSAQLRQIQDFKMQIQQASTMAERTGALGGDYANATVDKTGTKFTPQAAGLELKDLPVASDVKVQMARTPTQKVKFYTVDRMVNNKVTITRNYGIEFSEKARVVNNMGPQVPYDPEALGVKPVAAQPGAPKAAPVVEEVPPPAAPEVPMGKPTGGGGRAFMQRAKAGFKAGLASLWSAETIVGAGATLLLAYADKVAAEAAIKRIQIFFIKEGFAKGYTAGVLGWNETEVATEALNRVTDFRVHGMSDAGGKLTRAYILKLAETYENYAVAVGWNYAYNKPNAWKKEVVTRGMNRLKASRYDNWGSNANVLFEYAFLAKLAWALRNESDAIVGPAIRTGK
jgi:hypothetical protein